MVDILHAQYERLRVEIGTTKSVELGPVRRRDFERFATAVGLDQVTNASDPMTAPHLYLSSVMGWGAGPPEDDLGADGTSARESRGFPLAGLRLMGAGQDLDFHNPVRDSMTVTETTLLDDVQLKAGRSGPLLTIQLVRRFFDQAGTLLVTCRETFIGR